MGRKNNKGKNTPALIENALLKISILGLLSLVTVQFFLSNTNMKTILDNNSEAISIEESSLYHEKGKVEIEIENFSKYNKLLLLKNGEIVKDYIIEDNILYMDVYNGDVIEIDATSYKDKINVRIKNTSDNIDIPKEGDSYISDQNILYLFKTKMLDQD